METTCRCAVSGALELEHPRDLAGVVEALDGQKRVDDFRLGLPEDFLKVVAERGTDAEFVGNHHHFRLRDQLQKLPAELPVLREIETMVLAQARQVLDVEPLNGGDGRG